MTFAEDPAADVNLKAHHSGQAQQRCDHLDPVLHDLGPGERTDVDRVHSWRRDRTLKLQTASTVSLPAGTNGTSVTGIAVVAGENPGAPAPITEDKGAADAHRVFGTGASPSPSASTTSPSPTPSTSSPTSSPSPTATQTTASPSPTTSTPPPPVIYPSETTLKNDGNKFFGKVKSQSKKCRSGRQMILKKKKSGDDKTVGKDKTNQDGEYSIKENNPNGTYYTIAKKKSYTTNSGGPVTCQKDKSPEAEGLTSTWGRTRS